jgi:hypothetical protein
MLMGWWAGGGGLDTGGGVAADGRLELLGWRIGEAGDADGLARPKSQKNFVCSGRACRELAEGEEGGGRGERPRGAIGRERGGGNGDGTAGHEQVRGNVEGGGRRERLQSANKHS